MLGSARRPTTSPSPPLGGDAIMGAQVEYLFAASVMIADQAARRQGWRPRGRTSWHKPDGVEVRFISLAGQLAIVEPGMTVHVVGKAPPELRRLKRITVTSIGT